MDDGEEYIPHTRAPAYDPPPQDIDVETFREAVLLYKELSNEISKATKQMTMYKKQKDQLGDTVLLYMKENGIEQCALPDGSTLVRRQAKRTATLKKGDIIETLSNTIGDEAKAVLMVTRMYDTRQVTYKDALSLRKGKS
jgi:hypothetical protein